MATYDLYYPRYHKDIREDLKGRSLEAEGFYTRLSDLFWTTYTQGGTVPADVDWLAREMNLDRRRVNACLGEIFGPDLALFRGCSERVLAKVRANSRRSSKEFSVNSGQLRHPQMEADASQAIELSKKRAATGRRGGQANARAKAQAQQQQQQRTFGSCAADAREGPQNEPEKLTPPPDEDRVVDLGATPDTPGRWRVILADSGFPPNRGNSRKLEAVLREWVGWGVTVSEFKRAKLEAELDNPKTGIYSPMAFAPYVRRIVNEREKAREVADHENRQRNRPGGDGQRKFAFPGVVQDDEPVPGADLVRSRRARRE